MLSSLLLMLIITTTISASKNENYIFPKLPNYVENSKSETCKNHSELYKAHLKNYTFWAQEMWDSSAKYTTGVLRGNIQELGDFDQCITVQAPFITQYCIVKLTAHVPSPKQNRDPLSLQYDPYESVFHRIHKTNDTSQVSRDSVQIALCVPASCSPKDLEENLNRFVNGSNVGNVTYEVQVPPILCRSQDFRKSFDGPDALFCVVLCVLLLLVLSATIVDNFSTNDHLYLVFSAKRNFKQLINNEHVTSQLAILNGMKTFSILVIIVMHRFIWSSISYLKNFDYVEKQYRQTHATFMFHSDLIVDSFFLFSGCLMAYVLLNKKINNPFILIAVRYLRLTPAYAFIILYYSSLFYYIGSGPFWNLLINWEINKCKKNWWLNLLYINNYVDARNICMPISWYLSCDFHFFIIGVLVVMTYKRNKKVGLFLLLLLLLTSVTLPFVVTIVHEFPAVLKFHRSELLTESSSPYFFEFYIKSHVRVIPYLIGIIAGYIYFRLKGKQWKLSKLTTNSLIIGSLVALTLTLYSGSIFFDPYYKYNVLKAGAYQALNKLFWSVSTMALMVGTTHGTATQLKKFLSLNIWSIGAKLSFSAYLLHIQFDLRSFASVNSSNSFNIFNIIHLALGDVMITFMISFFLYLGVEAPIVSLTKMLLKSDERIQKGQLALEPSDMPLNGTKL